MADPQPSPVKGRLALWAMRLGARLVPMVPREAAYVVADMVGLVAYGLAENRRRALVDNLSAVVGVDDVDLLALRAREAFRTQARNYVDLFGLARLTLDEVRQRVEVVGQEHLPGAPSSARGAVLATLHLGNFDAAMQVGPLFGFTLTLPVERIDPPELLDLVCRLRGRHGVNVLPIGRDTVAEVGSALRAGHLVPVAVDRDAQGSGVATSFLGRRARLSHAAVALALRTGAPLLPIRSCRLPDGRYRVQLGPPIARPKGPSRGAAAAMMAGLVAALEEFVRQTPGQWVMFERLFEPEDR